MRIEFPRPLLVASLFIASLFLTLILIPTAARAQEPTPGQRGLAASQPSPQPQPAGTGRYHALVIGNQAYTSLPRLKTAEVDARAVDALLREFYGFETKLLLDATRQQIVSAIYAYRRTLEPDANLLIYYAGHGIKDPEEEKAYWLPVDAARDDPSNWIIADEITTRIKVIPARHVLIVSDSCYSGTLTRGINASLPRPGEREQFLRRMQAGRSRTLMASGGDEPVADGGGGTHSIFANALLRVLREMDKDGFTAAELFRGHVEESVAGRAHQMPEYQTLRNSGHESGDFVFVRTRTSGRKGGEPSKAAPPGVVVAPLEASMLETEHWRTIEQSGDPEEYRRYAAKYPNGQFAGTARERAGEESDGKLARSDDVTAFVEAGNNNSPASNPKNVKTDGVAASGGARQSKHNEKSSVQQSSPEFNDRRERQPQIPRDAAEPPSARGEPSAPGRRP